MDRFDTLASPNCRNFVASSKCFVGSGMDTIDSIMMLRDHLDFNYVYGSKFRG